MVAQFSKLEVAEHVAVLLLLQTIQVPLDIPELNSNILLEVLGNVIVKSDQVLIDGKENIDSGVVLVDEEGIDNLHNFLVKGQPSFELCLLVVRATEALLDAVNGKVLRLESVGLDELVQVVVPDLARNFLNF